MPKSSSDEPHAELLERAERLVDRLAVAHEHALGELQLEPVGLEARVRRARWLTIVGQAPDW